MRQRASILLHPLLVFAVVWAMTPLLLSLRMSEILQPLPREFVMPFIASLFGGAISGYALGAGFKILARSKARPSSPSRAREAAAIDLVLSWLTVMAVALFALNVFYFRDLPLLTYVAPSLGRGIAYSEFGIPTVFGFTNGLTMFVGTLAFWRLLNGGSKTSKTAFIITVALPVLAVHRYTLMTLSLQCLFVYIGVRGGVGRQVTVKAILMATAAFAAFSVLGSIRNDNSIFRSQVALRPQFEWMPTSLLWVYMYVTTPLNNFAYAFHQFRLPMTRGLLSLSQLIPSFIRNRLPVALDVSQFLYTQTFNVYCYAFHLYVDWRWPGVALFTATLLGLGGWSYAAYVRTGSVSDLIRLAIINQITVLTVFTNQLFTWAILLQLMLTVMLEIWTTSRSGKRISHPVASSRGQGGGLATRALMRRRVVSRRRSSAIFGKG